jgi:hypothetical protein
LNKSTDVRKNFLSEKKYLLHVGLTEGTSDGALYDPWRGSRREAVEAVKTFSQHGLSLNDTIDNTVCPHLRNDPTHGLEIFMTTISKFKFVLSPPGRGPDTHRTWEALLAGSIPIVQAGPMDALYFDLPVLTVEKWGELSEKFLVSIYPFLLNRKYKFEKLFAPYWMERIRTAFDQ